MEYNPTIEVPNEKTNKQKLHHRILVRNRLIDNRIGLSRTKKQPLKGSPINDFIIRKQNSMLSELSY
ncbi:hypothetical protein M2263_000393 [Providencia alcalifaciens]|nr:hypothetical protein [Providencia alcalifaciens]